MCYVQKFSRNDARDYTVLPCTGLGDICKFFEEVLPPADAMHMVMGTHPRLELLEEARHASSLMKELQSCWRRSNGDSMRMIMSLKDIAGKG
jgi:hypothetical protein